jgi:hypothetical protein
VQMGLQAMRERRLVTKLELHLDNGTFSVEGGLGGLRNCN